MAKQRVGYALGYGKFTNVREMADVMQQAEERGFEMAFFSETVELMRDSVSSLAAISLATKNMVMGTTQIVRLRGPVVMAQSLATLDELSGGRITAAPGACTKSHARVHALPQDVGATPSEVLREYIESMRLLFSGDKVSYHGKFVNFDNVGLGWKPIRAHIPFYVPATATIGLKLA
ncbi:MAG TPA: LLM class flavin-dependent oxidoreductase, partial [Candidatus Binatia bacterium]